MRRSEFMTRCTRQTTHAIARGSTIGDRPDVQHGLKIDAVTSEPKPIIENGSTLFKSTTVQKTGSGTIRISNIWSLMEVQPTKLNWC